MSKHSRKKSGDSVAELDDALEALPEDGDGARTDEEGDNPLEQVDVSGATSFESAEFATEYEGGVADDERRQEEEGEVVIHDADAEDRAEELARQRAEAAAAGVGEEAGGEV